MSAPEYSAEQMMQRWFRNLKPTKNGRGKYAWSVVSEVFAVGSTVAMDQCERYGLPSHAKVRSLKT